MSYKLNADEIRTIDRKKYKFSCNGLKPQTIDEMLEVSFLFIYSFLLLSKKGRRLVLTMLLLATLSSIRPVKWISRNPTSFSNVLFAPFLGKFYKSIVGHLLLLSNGGNL